MHGEGELLDGQQSISTTGQYMNPLVKHWIYCGAKRLTNWRNSEKRRVIEQTSEDNSK